MTSHRRLAPFLLAIVALGLSLSPPLMVTAQQPAQPAAAAGVAPISEGREYEYSTEPGRAEASEQQTIIMMPAVPASQARGLHGTTPLMDAAEAGELKAVEALLAKGAEVNAQDNFGGTALIYAAREGHADVVRMLIAHGADVNARSTSGTGVHIATDNGHLDVVRLLLAHGADVDAKDYGGETALISAIRRGRTDIVLELLQQGADPNAKRRGTGHVSVLEMAVSSHNALAVTALLTKGADLDQYGASALALAAEMGLTDIVKILVEGGVSADAADKWRRTALHHAVTAGRTDTVATLLAHGADVNAKDYLGRTALSLAAEAGQERMVDLLLAHGADTNSRDNQGNTPLVYADLGAHRAIVQKLLPTDQSKDRPPVSLVFAREKDGKCEISLWNPYTAQAKQLLSLPTCPKHVFVADGKTSIFIPHEDVLQEVQFSPKVRVKTPIRLPKTDLERHQFKVGEKTETAAYIKKHVTWIRPVAAGYLDRDIFGVTMGIALPWDTDYAFLYALQNGTWVLLDEQHCGRFGVCRFGALNGRRSDVWSWKQERRVWHPSHALNRYVVDRQVVRDADGSPSSGQLTFDINGRTSILTFFLDRGPDSGATLTFGITLQAGSRPVQELLGQCETSLANKYLLFNKFWGGLRLIDLETGESVLGELKLATWIN